MRWSALRTCRDATRGLQWVLVAASSVLLCSGGCATGTMVPTSRGEVEPPQPRAASAPQDAAGKANASEGHAANEGRVATEAPAADSTAPAAGADGATPDAQRTGAQRAPGDLPSKTVIGGNNTDPQMGIFLLDAKSAAEVDARMDDLEEAYRHALRVATKSWAGKRTFCEDAVRQIIGFYAIDGMLDEAALAAWKSADPDRVRAKHLQAIVARHKLMYDEHEPKVCAATLQTYVEALRFAARQKLLIRNFGY